MKRLMFVVLFLTAGCSEPPRSPSGDVLSIYEGIYTDARMTPEIQEKWARSCALCHAAGVGDAPRVGMKDEWQTRTAKGPGLLIYNTIEGLNQMPPLGYCQDCELSDFAAMIKMMAGEDS